MSGKTFKEVIFEETVGQSIMSALRSKDPFVFDKLNAKNLMSSSSSFKFDIAKYEIKIAQNISDKKYLITFATTSGGKTKIKHKITDIENINDILPLINEYLEGE
jgi:hypothetical protein